MKERRRNQECVEGGPGTLQYECCHWRERELEKEVKKLKERIKELEDDNLSLKNRTYLSQGKET